MKAIVIGRHEQAPIEGIEIVERRAVAFPATAEKCEGIIAALCEEAAQQDAGILFQNTPGQVSVCLAAYRFIIPVGVIVSKPGPRPEEGALRFEFPDAISREACKTMVQFANPRAKIEVDGDELIVSVASPMRFEFSHIEWFSTPYCYCGEEWVRNGASMHCPVCGHIAWNA